MQARDPTRPPELLHPHLIAPGAALLIAAFATDLVYWQTPSSQWETFSIWLLSAALIVAGLSGLALVLDVVLGRLPAIAWWKLAGVAAAAVLSLLNAFVHSRDGFTAVVPQGLALSAIVTVLLLVVGWRGWSLSALPPSNPIQSRGVRP
jgi:uncharacterized membrane protein